MEESFITFSKKSGKIQTGEIDPVALDSKIQSLNREYLDNEVAISDGLIKRENIKDELAKLIAITEQLPK